MSNDFARLFKSSDPRPKIGTRVRVTSDYPDIAPKGTLGTVKAHSGGYVEIEWDQPQSLGQYSDGTQKYAYGRATDRYEYETYFEEL
jgi:hypothetical protein